MLPKVSIIILNWNGKEDTIECLKSLKDLTYSNYKIILVDNASIDGSVEYINSKYPEILVIENKENLGFAEGNNVALRWAIENGTDYILLLNNDTVVSPNFLSELVNVAEGDPHIGVLGPTIYYYNDVNKIQSAGGKIYWNRGKAPHITYEDGIAKTHKTRDVDYVTGCALLAKVEVFQKVGLLESAYFAYWEETDWCVCARKAGYRIVHILNSKIWHKHGSSSRKRSGFYEYQMTRNMFWFMRRNATRRQYISFLVYFFGFQFWLSTGFHLHKLNTRSYYSFLKGIKDGISNSKGYPSPKN